MRNRVEYFLLRFVLVLLPFISVAAVLFVNGYGFNFNMLIPAWNDEVGWFHQIDAMINYGHPLGYYGYNGSFAEVGTFGPWGIAPLLPYALFGKVFGWELNSMAIANICFLCVALLLFVLLAKPTNRQVVWIILFYLCSTITIGYSMTSMSEGLRYSIAIIIAGILLWLERETKNGLKTKQKILVLGGGIAFF